MGPEASNHAAAFLIDSICLRQSFFSLPSSFSCCLSVVPSATGPAYYTACLTPCVLPPGRRKLAQPERERLGEGERGRERERARVCDEVKKKRGGGEPGVDR